MVEDIRSTLETGQQETEDITSGASFVFSNKWRKIPEVPDQNQEDIIANSWPLGICKPRKNWAQNINILTNLCNLHMY